MSSSFATKILARSDSNRRLLAAHAAVEEYSIALDVITSVVRGRRGPSSMPAVLATPSRLPLIAA
jgi:hypothetical protein